MRRVLLAALLASACEAPPASLSADAGDPALLTQGRVAEFRAAMEAFHRDTGGWPIGDSVWYGGKSAAPLPEIAPQVVTENDTALFKVPRWQGAPIPACPGTSPCWGGPYLTGASHAAELVDGWGHPLLIAYIRPFDGGGGGIATAPNGIILLWSAGPDGKDETGCTGGECAFDSLRVAQGLPSVEGADDVIVVVANNSCEGSPPSYACP